MLDGRLLIDAHVHAARLPTLKPAWRAWAEQFGQPGWTAAYTEDGTVSPAALDDLMAAEGVDHAILLCEYSPKVTGIQPVEDLLPIIKYNPDRFAFLANINPHLHYPVKAELARQAALGAVACKIHPVHGGFEPADRMLYPAYAWCEERGMPVIVHCGTSTFAGSVNAFGAPELLDSVFRDFPDLTVVLAHGGRGWWYDQAAFLALIRPNVWLEVSGLPPARLPDYYGRSLARLAAKMVFGTDWPGVPGVQRNARTLEKVLLEAGATQDDVALALGGSAARIFRLPG
jgi:uncharacterized protein